MTPRKHRTANARSISSSLLDEPIEAHDPATIHAAALTIAESTPGTPRRRGCCWRCAGEDAVNPNLIPSDRTKRLASCSSPRHQGRTGVDAVPKPPDHIEDERPTHSMALVLERTSWRPPGRPVITKTTYTPDERRRPTRPTCDRVRTPGRGRRGAGLPATLRAQTTEEGELVPWFRTTLAFTASPRRSSN